jgi:thymidylate synthase
MIKADKYLKETIQEILKNGSVDQNPRAKYKDGTPAHCKYITHQVYQYDISAGEFPITTLRNTALKAAFHDIEAIYIKQTNILEEMHPSIHSWWKDFCHQDKYIVKNPSFESLYSVFGEECETVNPEWIQQKQRALGRTYGDTVSRYRLMKKLLRELEENPFGRRHKINLWQEAQEVDDPKALVPCAGMTLWTIRERDYTEDIVHLSNEFGIQLEYDQPQIVRYLDLSLTIRSSDYLTAAYINQNQYVMLAMMVANHLTFKTGIEHKVGKFTCFINNAHIYSRHIPAAYEILQREPINYQSFIILKSKPKDFYEHTVDDFEFILAPGIKKLDNELELAI